ncbi:SymE family type I addiction module toxin [Enterocloster clostridioformis]|uniref:SymE family type I addiction module toxin n=1 Tax=Enterocloster clostridioformis TaxID=1531 RepID=UPI0034A5B0B8
MKTKNIKVLYTNRYASGSVPKIQMEGKWLEALGFSIGDQLLVEYSEGEIHIRRLTEEECIAKERETLQAEISRRTAELCSLKDRAERQLACMIAEPSEKYSKAVR